MIATLGISLAASTVIMLEMVVSVIGMIMGIIGAVSSAFTAVAAVGGIYNTGMGVGSKYDKAEDFAHDTTMLAVSMFNIWGSVTMIKNNLALFKSASQNLEGRTTRPTPSEVVNSSKNAEMISGMDELLDYTKGFMDDDALQYVKEVLNNDGDDIAQLKKIAQLVEDGSKKIGKKLSKEELKAGLDALWNDGGVEGALEEIERYSKWGKLLESVNDLTLEQKEAFTKYSGDVFENINNSLRGLEEATIENQETINIMKSALDNASLPRDMVVYRGTDKVELGILKNLSPEDLIFKEIDEPAFLSTTTKKALQKKL